MIWPFGELQPFGHDLIVADPPWPFDLYSAAGDAKSAAAHYDTMSFDELAAMPVGQLARGHCLMAMCCCAPTLPMAIKLLEIWDFTYKSHIIWLKVSKNSKPMMGPGYRVRTMHEVILLGTIGNPKHKAFKSVFAGVRREHSRKPEELYKIIEKNARPLAPLDLFSRQSRPGWSVFGRETGKFDVPAPPKIHVPTQPEVHRYGCVDERQFSFA